MLKKAVRSLVYRLGYQIKPIRKGKPSPIHLWEEDLVFQQRFAEIRSYTLVSKQRCHMLYQLVQHVAVLPGHLAEIGVYKGGTARLLAKTMADSDKQFHLFDTFEGMPVTDPTKDTHVQGAFGDTTLAAVTNYLQDCERINLYKGFFPQTAHPIENKQFCFVHVDVDIYQSVIDCCHFFYDRLCPRGILIFDDYGDLSCPGAREAVDEFFADKPEYPCYLSTGQCLVVKH